MDLSPSRRSATELPITCGLCIYANNSMESFRVCFAGREHYRLHSPGGAVSARLSGTFRYNNSQFPVVGDYVSVDGGLIRSILPRTSKFSRRAPGRRDEEQVLAANVDVALVVCGLDGDYNPRRIERYLVLVRESGARGAVVLNKCDLRPAPDVSFGVPVIETSTRMPGGLDALLRFVEPGLTYVLLGSSGAGKSSIGNCLMGEDVQRTSEVREHDSRGRHTTTHRELIELPSGAFLIDTPGLREIQLWAGEESVEDTFEDIASRASSCRFRDCRHAGEPGCAVAKALESGELDEWRGRNYGKLTSEVRTMDKKTLKKLHKNRHQYKQTW